MAIDKSAIRHLLVGASLLCCYFLLFFSHRENTFDVLLWLQVTSFDVSLLRSRPDGADHIHIDIFVLHTCTPPPRYGSNKNLCLGSRQFLNVCIDNPDCSFFTRLLTRIAT